MPSRASAIALSRSRPSSQRLPARVLSASVQSPFYITTWLGATDEQQEGDWHCIDGNTLVFKQWVSSDRNLRRSAA